MMKYYAAEDNLVEKTNRETNSCCGIERVEKTT